MKLPSFQEFFKRAKKPVSGVRPPKEDEYALAKAALGKKRLQLGSIGVDIKSGTINIEDTDGGEWVMNAKRELKRIR